MSEEESTPIENAGAPRFVFGPRRVGDYRKFGVPAADPPVVEPRDARVDFLDAVNQADGILATLYVEKGQAVVRPVRLHLAVTQVPPAEDAEAAAWLAGQPIKAAIDVSDEPTQQVLVPPPDVEGLVILQSVLEFAS